MAGGNNSPQQYESSSHGRRPWTDKDMEALHELLRNSETLEEIVQDYKNAQWFRRQAKWWALWVLGLPATIVTFWDPLEKIWRAIRGH